jgi:hypothetical protein
LLFFGELISFFSHEILVGTSKMKLVNEPSKMATEWSPGRKPGVNARIGQRAPEGRQNFPIEGSRANCQLSPAKAGSES